MNNSFTRTVGPARVWRCTEAVDPQAGYAFRTIGSPEGRCIEIVAPNNTMLFDRRLARRLAKAILEVCGPDEELDSDLAQAGIVEIVYGEAGRASWVAGFQPYVSQHGNPMLDAAAFVQKVRDDAGLPPSRLFPDYPETPDA